MIAEQFYDAEEVVRWAADSTRLKGCHTSTRIYDRPCEVSDVFIVARRLKMSGQIDATQYVLFQKFVNGEIEIIPDRFYNKWNDFLLKLGNVMKAKNIIARGTV